MVILKFITMKIPKHNQQENNISNFCPVPIGQIPSFEFYELCSSWFFSWPTKEKTIFYRFLFNSWLITLPFTCFLFLGSYSLANDITRIIIVSAISSLFFPIILLLRQLLGWNYIKNRLVSKNIEYEETGWYDGQIWEKPTEWRERDILIAAYEVKPIIRLIKTSMMLLGIIFISCIIPNLLNIYVIRT